MELTEEKIIKAKSYNSKLFPIYKMFSWDLLFYYSINFLFLTQAKGLSASLILFGDSFYYIFKVVFQIPCVNVVEILGNRRSLVLGNIFISASILSLILGTDLESLIICNLFMSIGFSIKAICELVVLNESVSFKENPRTVFTNIDAKGSSLYFYLDAFTAIACGFLFIFNNYLPIFICFIFTIISIVLSCKFLPYENSSKRIKAKRNGGFKEYFKDLKIAFKSILKSNRLKALLLFCGLYAAILTVRSVLSNSLLVEIGVREEFFGIIKFFLTLVAAIASKHQDFFHKKFRNKVLTFFSMTFSLSMIIAGLSAIIIKNTNIVFGIVIFIYAIWNVVRAPYYTLQKRYLNSFASPDMSAKIYSACTLIEAIFTTLVYWIASFMLNNMPTSFAVVLIGCLFAVAFIFILDYMRDRVGLKPEEYNKSDINLGVH